ncbi:relaxase/mobilization nuclease domain-containing protein [Desulfovibrio sp. OttesenSCG-928-C14]|nr:relaxase/mobilization nuclease domain-containing protein [Desulfovibrio sp. OttesenSCG-928-C14]
MISKRVFIKAGNDNYVRLAAYIADAGTHSKQGGEKCLMNWCEGMLGGEDYAEGIAEAKDVQARNTRAASKTYHLVISFRPEDEEKLTPEVFKAIEARFASALGYTDHQRHCGVHKNTANLHMHVAYNMIHPEKYTCHKEFRDFWIRDRVCRAVEREFGLTVDHGIEQSSSDRSRANEKARLVEAHTGQQSFDFYAKGHREEILHSLEAATSWQDIHAALAAHGMEIKPYGNGLAIKDRHSSRSTNAIKASVLDRSLSLKKLEARFGAFQPPRNLDQVQERSRYIAAPLHRSPERGQLFAEYQAGIEARKATLQTIKDREDAALAAIRAEWAVKRRELERKNIAKKNLRRLLQIARKHEAEALAIARLSFQEPRSIVRQEIPFTSWNGFLQHKAEQGNEIALAVLRSRTHTVAPEQDATKAKNWSQHGMEQASASSTIRAGYAAREREILELDGISGKGKNRLQAVLRMEQVFQQNNLGTSEFQHHIDRKGTVVFTLRDGACVRDSGEDVLFSVGSESAKQAATLYARKKWGQQVVLEKNRLVRHENPNRAWGMER